MKSMKIFSSFVHVDRAVIIASGEKYPESGILSSFRSTRLLVDKRSRGASGNGIPFSQNHSRHGADPPKNSVPRTGAVSSISSLAQSRYTLQRWICLLHRCRQLLQERVRQTFKVNVVHVVAVLERRDDLVPILDDDRSGARRWYIEIVAYHDRYRGGQELE